MYSKMNNNTFDFTKLPNDIIIYSPYIPMIVSKCSEDIKTERVLERFRENLKNLLRKNER